jgi:hypothetical protein
LSSLDASWKNSSSWDAAEGVAARVTLRVENPVTSAATPDDSFNPVRRQILRGTALFQSK